MPAETRYDSLIQAAGTLLKDGPVAELSHVNRLWSEIVWNKMEEQRVTSDTEVARDGSHRISLYPSLLEKSSQAGCYALIREFGHLLYAQAKTPLKRRWTNKLCLPKSEQIDAVQRKLTPDFKSYRDMVESFKTAMDRYVALNLANAMIANGVPYAQSQNVNLRKWGATQAYANLRRYHPLVPLISAYSSQEIFEDFGAALADWICGTQGITESSVAEAAHELVRDLLNGLR
jgi:hypothetical protein